MNILEEMAEALSEALLEGNTKGPTLTKEALEALEAKARKVIHKRVDKITDKAVNVATAIGQLAKRI